MTEDRLQAADHTHADIGILGPHHLMAAELLENIGGLQSDT